MSWIHTALDMQGDIIAEGQELLSFEQRKRIVASVHTSTMYREGIRPSGWMTTTLASNSDAPWDDEITFLGSPYEREYDNKVEALKGHREIVEMVQAQLRARKPLIVKEVEMPQEQ